MSLELSRSVNDSLQSGDYTLAFDELRSQPDMRLSDLPKVEKKSLSSLAEALSAETVSHLWAKALLDEAASVRLFAHKTLLRLKNELTPVAKPLDNELRDFWRRHPLREKDSQVHQQIHEMLARAIEILFCADTGVALSACSQQIEIHAAAARLHTKRRNDYVARRDAAQNAFKETVIKMMQEAGLELLPNLYYAYQAPPKIISLAKS